VKPSFEIAATGQLVAVRLHGICTREFSPFFMEAAGALVAQADNRQLMVDVTECRYMDSTFLGCLLALYRRADTAMWIRADDAGRQLFASARIDQVISVRDELSPIGSHQWTVIVATDEPDAARLVRQVADAHRQLADMEGPHAEVCRTIAEQLEQEITDAEATTDNLDTVRRGDGD